MRKLKVALLTIAESRENFYQQRKAIVAEECGFFERVFSKRFAIIQSVPIKTLRQALEWTDRSNAENVDAIIIFVPVWASPNLAAKIAENAIAPILILGNLRPESSSFGCMLAVAGAMEQIGHPVHRVIGDINDKAIQWKVLDFVFAAHAKNQIRRSNYCIFGGRSLGIVSTQADFSEWGHGFGVECDHKDQYEIVNRAELIDKKRTIKYLDWLESNIGKITYSGKFTKESLLRQINCYLAVKDIIGENGYDFISIKCQTELSDGYALMCLAISLLNDIYDAEGRKEAVPCSCEGDNDGALTMYMLSLLSGGMPASLMDVRLLKPEEKELIIANCGGAPTYFAGQSKDAVNNLKNVYLMEHIFGEAGGAAVQYVCAEGDVTLARLFKRDGKYCMGMMEGKFLQKDREELRKTTFCYPHGFVTGAFDFQSFLQTFGANHIHAVLGLYKNRLKILCKLLGISWIDYNN